MAARGGPRAPGLATTTLPLAGRVALVTGAGAPDGIGFAVAAALVADGATVVLSSTTARVHARAAELAAAAAAAGTVARGVVADLMVRGAADALVADVIRAHGALDLLVNNAGMTAVGLRGPAPGMRIPIDGGMHIPIGGGDGDRGAPAWATDDEAWADGLARNLTLTFTVTRAALAAPRGLRAARGGGRVVNVASTSGPVSACVCARAARPPPRVRVRAACDSPSVWMRA